MSESEEAQLLAWGVVANVAPETAHGEGGLTIQSGLRHFSPGAKLWVLPPQWGDGGERLVVVGRHRGSRGRHYSQMVVPKRHLINFRVRAIYSPALLRALSDGRRATPHMLVLREQILSTVCCPLSTLQTLSSGLHRARRG